MENSEQFHRIVLALLSLVFVALAGWYSVQIPPGEGVDEAAHFRYVKYVKEQRALPVQPMEPRGVKVGMGHHPPLYYVLGALGILWIDTADFDQVLRPNPHYVWAENDGSNGWNVMLHFGQDAWPWRGAILGIHIVRWVSVALGVVATVAVYCTVRYLVPEHPWVPLGAASLMAFNPSFIYMSSTVHHDVLLTAIFSLGLWWAVRTVLEPVRGFDLWVGGLLAGGAALTKVSGVGLVVVMALALLLKAWPSRDWKGAVKQTAHLVGVALLVSGWWYARNQLLYGDLLGWQMFLSLFHFNVRQTPYTWYLFWNEFVVQMGRTFWGAFGFMHITFPGVSRYLWLVTGVAVLGLGGAIVRRIRHQRQIHWTPQVSAWLVVLAGLAGMFILFVRYSITISGGGHARYLFPAAPAIGGLLIIGFNGFTNWRHQLLISMVVTIGMLAYSIWMPVSLVLPKYAAPEVASSQELVSAHPGDWIFGDAVRLVAYDYEPALAIPDAWLHMRFFWQAIGPSAERPDVYAHARLVTNEGEILHPIEFWPAESTTPAVWTADQIVVSQQFLHVPAGGHTGQLHVDVTLTSGRGGEPLPVRQSAGVNHAGHVARLGPIPAVGQVVEVSDDAVPNRRSEVLGSIALAGYGLPEELLGSEEVMIVSLYFFNDTPPTEIYTVFVHVLDDQGQLVAQFDRPPGGGTSPTTSWEPGQILLDTYPVPIPEDLAAGEYDVHVGMYTWPSLERQNVSMDGVAVGDSVLLGTVHIR